MSETTARAGRADQDPDGMLVDVRLVRTPIRIWERASMHTAELLREFSLLQIGIEQAGDHDVPARLLQLVADLEAQYSGVSEEPELQRDVALRAGKRSLDLVYRVPPEVADACVVLRDRLDEADEYCRRGRELMTLASPPDQVAFRNWFLGEFVAQIAGRRPTPWHGSLE